MIILIVRNGTSNLEVNSALIFIAIDLMCFSNIFRDSILKLIVVVRKRNSLDLIIIYSIFPLNQFPCILFISPKL